MFCVKYKDPFLIECLAETLVISKLDLTDEEIVLIIFNLVFVVRFRIKKVEKVRF